MQAPTPAGRRPGANRAIETMVQIRQKRLRLRGCSSNTDARFVAPPASHEQPKDGGCPDAGDISNGKAPSKGAHDATGMDSSQLQIGSLWCAAVGGSLELRAIVYVLLAIAVATTAISFIGP